MLRMKKMWICCYLITFLLVNAYISDAVADNGFVFKNKIKFGMTSEEVARLENIDISTIIYSSEDSTKYSKLIFPEKVTLGEINEYELSYSFADNRLTSISYHYRYPISFNLNDANRKWENNQLGYGLYNQYVSDYENIIDVINILVEKYGKPGTLTMDENNGRIIARWYVKYSGKSSGVSIEVMHDLHEKTSKLLRGVHITYLEYDYQDEIDEENQRKKEYQNSVNSL